jgi:hypothetical protein
MGVPSRWAPTLISSMSAILRMYPRPRTMYSRPVNSMTRPPTSWLLRRTRSTTRLIGMS